MLTVKQIPLVAPVKSRKKRVAAYGRVSSGKDAMLHSLSAQVSYYSSLIQRNPDWIFCGVYSDEAISGTKEDRNGFQELLADCRAGKIDMVITKSISRFARNTVTLLEAVRELKSLGIDVYFEEQNIHSLSGDGELLLTILASYAQEESRSVSENQKWRIRKNFSEGLPWTGTMLGYRYEDGVYVIKPDEAEIVKRIFTEYLSGKGLVLIMRRLNADGIPTRNGKPWSESKLRRVLCNYAYTGNLLLQKTFRESHLSKSPTVNKGELPMYHAENTHEAIISLEAFQAVQEEMRVRSRRHRAKVAPQLHPFNSLVVCGLCGATFRRRISHGIPSWMCRTFDRQGKAVCPAKQIREDILTSVTAEVLGLPSFDEKALHDKITVIRAFPDNTLVYCFKDGTEITTHWKDRSRAESWTPEMKAKERDRQLSRKEAVKCPQEA